MNLSKKQKKYIKENIKFYSLDAVANKVGVSEKSLQSYLTKIWGEDKYNKIVRRNTKNQSDTKNRIVSFVFKEWLKQSGYIIPLLVFLVFLVYFNSLNNGFLSDDISGIVQNPNIGNLSTIFTSPLSAIKFFQPLLYLVTYKLFGLSSIAFRFPNILFHLGSVFCVYFISYFLFNRKTALFSSVLMSVHPILTEAVIWISGGIHVQYSFFVLFSMLLYLLSVKNRIFLYLSLAIGLFSITVSEKAVVFPILLLGLEYVYKINKVRNWKKFIPFAILLVILGGALVAKIPDRISALKSDFYQDSGIANPLVYVPISITSYFKLILWPNLLTLYHTELNMSKLAFSINVGAFLIFLSVIITFFKKNKSIFYWLSFFIICLLPTLTPFGISWFVAERYVYLSSVGMFISVSYFIAKLYERPNIRVFVGGLFCVIAFALGIRTIIRNTDWKNQDSLWLASARTSPSSHQNHNNLGDMYGRHGDLDKAEEEFKKAIELQPNYADAYHNLANIYLQKEEFKKAIENYHKAVEINPGLWQSYSNLSGIYFQQENYLEAEKQINLAIKANPNVSMNYYNLAVTHYKLEKPNEVIPLLNKALDLDPENQQAKEFLNSVSFQKEEN